MSTFRSKPIVIALLFVLTIALGACGGQTGNQSGSKTKAEEATPGIGGSAIGFTFVGTKDDFGYNQQSYEASEYVEENTDLKIIRAEEIPESQEATRVMENMVGQGAKIIFPTSYGHLDMALKVAERHRDVIFEHQGGLKTAENLGTYFGNIWQPMYLSGITSGMMTESDKLGFVAAKPIPQVLLNINAFTRGARSVNSDIQTNVIFTNKWCNPEKQVQAASTLVDRGVDVLAQHQDCTKPVIEVAKRNDIWTAGYHMDVKELAPDHWITGAAWNWGPTYMEMIRTIRSGNWDGSKFDGEYRGGLEEGVVKLSRFGNKVPEKVKKEVLLAKHRILQDKIHPFEGPVESQDGTVKIKDGVRPGIKKLESTDYLVKGVVGNIPE